MKDKIEILKKYGWDGRIPYEDTITMHSADLLDAMQEYADQFKIANNLIDELIIIRSATHTQKDYNCFTIAIEKAKEYLPINDEI